MKREYPEWMYVYADDRIRLIYEARDIIKALLRPKAKPEAVRVARWMARKWLEEVGK